MEYVLTALATYGDSLILVSIVADSCASGFTALLQAFGPVKPLACSISWEV